MKSRIIEQKTRKNRMRIVLDTNVYISGILFGGNSRAILELIIEGKLDLFISEAIIKEINDVLLRLKFNFSQEVVRNIINEINLISELVNPKVKHDIIERDVDDNIIIDCAVESNSRFIITGDKDLLEIKKFKEIWIINPGDFLKQFP